MLPWKLRKRQILPVSQNLSSLYFSLAKFQLVSCNLFLAIIWQMTYTQKLPKLCPATLISNSRETAKVFRGMRDKINVMVGNQAYWPPGRPFSQFASYGFQRASRASNGRSNSGLCCVFLRGGELSNGNVRLEIFD